MKNLESINKQISAIIGLWKFLDFTELRTINRKGNNIEFDLLISDQKALDFLQQFQKILKTKHPVGDIAFIGHGTTRRVSNDTVENSITAIRKYRATVFHGTIKEDEYTDKLEIFYEQLIKLISEFTNDARNSGKESV